MYGPEELVMSSLRGASLAWSRPLFGSLHAMQWGAHPFTAPEHSLWLYMSLAVAYMHGSSHINTEEALWTDEYANDRYSESGRQHRYAQNRMLDFIQTHTRRGRQVSRIAVVQGRNDSWNVFNRGTLWSQEGAKWAFNDASRSFDLLKVFYPDHLVDWCGPENMFTHTPYGTVDLVPVEAPADVWKRYRVAVFLGWNTYDESDFTRLEEFVRGGGMLVMTAAHLNTELQPDRPVRFPDNDSLLRKMLGKDYRTWNGRKEIDYGEGRIIYFARKCYPADESIRDDYEKELYRLAGAQLAEDLPGGWIRTAEDVSYTVWEHGGSKTFYLLDADWQDGAPEKAVWSCSGRDFVFQVRPYCIETLHQYGSLAFLPHANTTDILGVMEPESGQGCATVIVQTAGEDVVEVMNASTGQHYRIPVPSAGLHRVPLQD